MYSTDFLFIPLQKEEQVKPNTLAIKPVNFAGSVFNRTLPFDTLDTNPVFFRALQTEKDPIGFLNHLGNEYSNIIKMSGSAYLSDGVEIYALLWDREHGQMTAKLLAPHYIARSKLSVYEMHFANSFIESYSNTDEGEFLAATLIAYVCGEKQSVETGVSVQESLSKYNDYISYGSSYHAEKVRDYLGKLGLNERGYPKAGVSLLLWKLAFSAAMHRNATPVS